MFKNIFFIAQTIVYSVLFTSCSSLFHSHHTVPHNDSNGTIEAKARIHMSYLSSDSLLGRDTPSNGLDQAADYIVNQLKEFRVEPINGNYFHTYSVERYDLASGATFSISKNLINTSFAIKDDFVPFSSSTTINETNLPLVFVGYGIVAPEYSWDDYKDIDVAGKVVVIISGEPTTENDSLLFRSTYPKKYSSNSNKIQTAQSKNARGCILLNNPLLSVRTKPVGSLFPSLSRLPQSSFPLTYRGVSSGTTTAPFGAVHAGESVTTALFGSTDSLSQIIRLYNKQSLSPFAFSPGISVSMNISILTESKTVRNVVGRISAENTEEKTNEHIIVGAHYDHVGAHMDSRIKPNELGVIDSIFNGADDNASGSTGLLLLAEYLSTKRIRETLKRDIVCIWFSGEEKGLLGSRAYTDTPLIPLTQCVTMLNMDMIGRNSVDSLSIGGNSRSPVLSSINENENAKLTKPFTLVYDIEEYFFRSDQANFALKNIPVLFYFSGMHNDYHRPSDEMHKIQFDKLIRASLLCMKTTLSVAASTKSIPYINLPLIKK